MRNSAGLLEKWDSKSWFFFLIIYRVSEVPNFNEIHSIILFAGAILWTIYIEKHLTSNVKILLNVKRFIHKVLENVTHSYFWD